MTEDNRSLNFTSLGPDDIAWADSCLSQDLDISDGGWSSLRDALLETLDAPNYSSPYEREDSPEDDLMEILYSRKTVKMHKAEEKNGNSFAASSEEADHVKYAIFENFNSEGLEPNSRDKSPCTSMSEGSEPNSDDRFNNENTEEFWVKHRVEDIFLPTYNESLRGLGISEREDSPEDDLMEILYSRKTVKMHKAEEKNGNSFAASSEEADHVKYAIFEIFNSEGLEPNSRDKSPSTSMSEGPEPNSDDRFNNENTEEFWAKHRVEDIFLPTYNESLRGLGISDPEVDFVFPEFPLEQSTEDIFKTWDFDIPLEENDLMKQLNLSLAENSTEPIPPVSDIEKLEILEDEPIDDLVSRIAELALSPKSNEIDI